VLAESPDQCLPLLLEDSLRSSAKQLIISQIPLETLQASDDSISLIKQNDTLMAALTVRLLFEDNVAALLQNIFEKESVRVLLLIKDSILPQKWASF